MLPVACIGYIDYCGEELDAVITENVKAMFFSKPKFNNVKPMDLQCEALNTRGFVTAPALANSLKFSLRHSRPRAWALNLRRRKHKPDVGDMQDTLLSLQSAPLALEMFLDKDGSESKRDSTVTITPSSGTSWKEQLKEFEQKFGKD